MGRAGPRPSIHKFDGPGRAAVHEIWALYGPPRPAHMAAHVLSRDSPGRGPWDVVYILLYYTIYYYFYSTTTTTPALPMRRPTGFLVPRHGPARLQVVLKRSEERFTVAMRYGPDPKFLMYTRTKQEQRCGRTAVVFWIG